MKTNWLNITFANRAIPNLKKRKAKNSNFLATIYINPLWSSTCLIYFSIFSGGVLLKKAFLKIAEISQETPLLRSPFIKVAGFAGSVILFKKYSTASVFLWNLRNLNTYLVEHLQAAASGSCKYSIWTCHKIKT